MAVILQSRFSNFNFYAYFWVKSVTFRQKNLPKSEKCSTFACFFAARIRGHYARERGNNNKQIKLLTKIKSYNAYNSTIS